jgi:acyl-CoA thioesterase
MAVLAPHVFEQSLTLDGAGGQYKLKVPPVWEGQPGLVYGGFALAAIVRVAGSETTAGRPVSVACQFLRPLVIDEVIQFDVAAVRRGRSSDLLRVSLSQSGKPAVDAQVRTTSASDGPTSAAEPLFALGQPWEYRMNRDVVVEDGWERVPAFEDHIEIRTDWQSDSADALSWSRLGEGIVYDDPYLEAARLALFLDQQAPAILNNQGYLLGPRRTELPWGFTNLDLLVHFHRARGTDWLCYVSDVIDGADGVASAQTRAWSESGDLLATAISQIAFFPTSGERRYG